MKITRIWDKKRMNPFLILNPCRRLNFFFCSNEYPIRAKKEYDYNITNGGIMSENLIKNTLERWSQKTKSTQPVITISSEAGSLGRIIAEKLARALEFNLFDQMLINAIAESADISAQVVESVERARFTGIQNFMSMLISKHHMEPNEYLHHLMPIVLVIAEHGHSVIFGRGANFIIPKEKRISVRIIAPLEKRIQNIAEQFNIPEAEARQRVINRDERRTAFVKQAFNANIGDPLHYELIMNSGNMEIEQIVAFLKCAVSETV
jgi:cytidylate kinase